MQRFLNLTKQSTLLALHDTHMQTEKEKERKVKYLTGIGLVALEGRRQKKSLVARSFEKGRERMQPNEAKK